ncbi:DUF6153 family protein [Streptomyces sp. NBC_00525]|uniref:DUF6153 family protein n=1 Tax=Streptomyces sp. NBC_00525 TaxID=2903660 RepID=UPI002E81D699|nr:DUF6153 family protein [Streptomyces sp. NBC_00525]WUC92261.1 DUF6153 family protein [Streptomyces sp. NBC_00525]
MTTRSRTRNRPTGRLYALLVLAVLAGILGMHALPASPFPAVRADHARAMAMPHAETGSTGAGQCAHSAGGTGHVGHADQMCAATGIGSPYTPPALSAAFSAGPAVAVRPESVPRSARDARAPPDLSELQLLRI